MTDGYSYPADIQRDADGRYVVVFPDFGWGATDGATREEALAEARDLLRELIATTLREGRELPVRSPAGEDRLMVVPSGAVLSGQVFRADIEAARRLLRRSGGQPPEPEDRLED